MWRAWQHDAEAAAGELERDRSLKNLALRGEHSRTDMHVYLCLFAYTRILHTSEMTCICIHCKSARSCNGEHVRGRSIFTAGSS